MTERLLKALPLGVFGALAITLVAIDSAPAQEPIPLRAPGGQPQPQPEPIPLPLPGQPGFPMPAQPVQPAQGEGIEVLAKGPVHEAFAATAEAPVAPPVVAKQPPEAIEELPPDQKPEGDNVQWIPGYWHWDEEGAQFIWVSGFWRQPPPGRVWVPGSWREVKGGWQYVPGFWAELAPRQPGQPLQPQPEIEYLPQPLPSLEIGPTVASPGEGYFYAPGSWVWRNKYLWRPGVWVEHRRDWVWAPARYNWTPAGYVFCDGHWDYPLATRGVLFAPVAFARPVYARPAFVYTPAYVVAAPSLTGALFVRRGYGNYYFGDYFDNRYVDRGYNAWCGTVGRGGFSIGFTTGRSFGYDPLWSYYSANYRNSPRWQGGVNDLYTGRYRGDVPRPPTTLVHQNTAINTITRTNVTNVTNNITVVDGAARVGNRDVSNVAMVAPLRVAPDLQQTRFEAVNAERRRDEAQAARQIRDVGAQRTRLETAAVAQAPVAPATPNNPRPAAAVPPRTIKLDVPAVAAQRAAVATEAKAPPPNPLRANTNPGARTDPRPQANPAANPPPRVDAPKIDVRPKVDPAIAPANPAISPRPKIDTPKVDPKPPAPVVQPKPPMNLPPVVQPRVEPKPIVTPPVAPRVDPKPPAPAPVVQPRIEPPKVNPLPPVQPRVEPKPVTVPPVNQPPVIQPKPPAPVVQPRPQPVAPVVQPPAPRIQPPAVVQPKPQPIAPPVVQPKPPAPAPVAPRVNPPTAPPVQPRAQPVVQPKPPAPAPIVQPRPQPAPVVQPKPAAPPVVQPRAQPAPVVQPRPQPAPVQPRAQPAPVVQPRPAPAAPPKAQPAPAGGRGGKGGKG